MAEFPAPSEGIVLTHFVVSGDVARSRRFYTDVLGGEAVMEGEPSVVALANSWIINTYPYRMFAPGRQKSWSQPIRSLGSVRRALRR